MADPAVVTDDGPLAEVHPLPQFAGSADDGTASRGPRADVAVVVHDAAFEHRPLADVHVRAKHGVGTDAGDGPDTTVVADEGGCDDRCRRVDLGALADPDAVAQQHGVDRDRDLAIEDVLVRLQVGVERAHVLPVALRREAVERLALLEELREDLRGEVDQATWRDVVEHNRIEHVDAGVDPVREHLAPGRLLQKPFDSPLIVGDDDAKVERVVHRLQGERGGGPGGVVEADELAKIDVGQHVARYHEEPLVELFAGVQHGTCRAERGLLRRVVDPHAELGAVTEVRADRVREESDRDDDLVEPVRLQQRDDVRDHRLIRHRQHRLRLARREGPQAGALATRHDDRLHGATFIEPGLSRGVVTSRTRPGRGDPRRAPAAPGERR